MDLFNARLLVEVEIDFQKPFKEANFFISVIFSDRTEFRKINEDPTFGRLSSLQQYLRKLKEPKETSEEIYKRIRPQSRRLARDHGLPKIHKEFVNLPKFQPIVDTTETVRYHVRKYLSGLFNSLTSNEYTIKDFFDVVTRIKSSPQELFDQGFRFASFDVVSQKR